MGKEQAMAMISTPTPGPVIDGAAGALTASAPVADTASEAQAPETPKEGLIDSTRFSHLAKKESELVKQREVFKKEQETLHAEKEKMKEIQAQITEFESTKQKDPVAALKILGFTETDIMNFLAAQEDNSTPEEKATKAAQKEIQAFRDEQSKEKQAAQEKQNEVIITNFKKDITKHVQADSEKYEYCAHHGPAADALIYETFNRIIKDTPEITKEEGWYSKLLQETTDIVENYYEEEDKRMSTLKKRQPKIDALLDAAPPKEAPLKAELSPRPKTLSNQISATVASTTVKRNETPAEKRARLIETVRNGGFKK